MRSCKLPMYTYNIISHFLCFDYSDLWPLDYDILLNFFNIPEISHPQKQVKHMDLHVLPVCIHVTLLLFSSVWPVFCSVCDCLSRWWGGRHAGEAQEAGERTERRGGSLLWGFVVLFLTVTVRIISVIAIRSTPTTIQLQSCGCVQDRRLPRTHICKHGWTCKQ